MPAYQPAVRGEDVLYQVLDQHLQTFLSECEERGTRLARHVRQELEDYLACGLPEHGFALLRCDGCGTARAVAFSCKHRGFCPSCTGRRMNNGAANLVDRVFPRVPVRQWVLSLPMPLRFRLAWDGALCREVLAVFLSTVFGYYREAAKEGRDPTERLRVKGLAEPVVLPDVPATTEELSAMAEEVGSEADELVGGGRGRRRWSGRGG